jgi:signal recognition particle subunit SEC65
MAIYLTCTRKKAQQKKHIDICHRCDLNTSCAPYQEYIQKDSNSAGRSLSTVTNKTFIRSDLLRDIVKELKEIKLVLEGSRMEEKTYPLINNTTSVDISIEYLNTELKTIKAIYDTPHQVG